MERFIKGLSKGVTRKFSRVLLSTLLAAGTIAATDAPPVQAIMRGPDLEVTSDDFRISAFARRQPKIAPFDLVLTSPEDFPEGVMMARMELIESCDDQLIISRVNGEIRTSVNDLSCVRDIAAKPGSSYRLSEY